MADFKFYCKDCGHEWSAGYLEYHRAEKLLFQAKQAGHHSVLFGSKGREAATQEALIRSTTIDFNTCPNCGSKKTKRTVQ